MDGSNVKQFLGTWRLTSIETRKANGELYRRGKRVGYLIYNKDGFMSVAFMKEERPLFKSGDIRGGTAEEKIAAFEGYVSYCGRYEIKDETIVHNIEVSLFPNWVGEKQERIFEFDGDRLTLSTPPMLIGGQHLSTHLIWERT